MMNQNAAIERKFADESPFIRYLFSRHDAAKCRKGDSGSIGKTRC